MVVIERLDSDLPVPGFLRAIPGIVRSEWTYDSAGNVYYDEDSSPPPPLGELGQPTLIAQAGAGTPWALAAPPDGGTVTLTHGTQSQVITATGFGFSVPFSATITGIEVSYLGYVAGAGGGIRDTSGYPALYLGSGSGLGTQVSHSSGVLWFAGPPVDPSVYGGPGDTWGTSVPITPAIVNDPSFGVQISGANGSTTLSQTLTVAQIEMTIYFSGGPDLGFVSLCVDSQNALHAYLGDLFPDQIVPDA